MKVCEEEILIFCVKENFLVFIGDCYKDIMFVIFIKFEI